MPQRSSHEAAYAVPEPGPSHVYLSSNGTVNNIYEKGQGFFTPLSLKQLSVRTQHIRRLLDIMHVCLEKGDRTRAARAWTILVRCPEVKPASAGWSKVAKEFDSKGRQTSARTVAAMTDRLLSNISRGPTRDDFDYLETHITSFPFSENPSIHVYAAMFAIFLGQESSARQPSVSGSSDTDMSSATEESAQREATSAFGHDQSGNRHPRLVSIQSGYHASALSYLRTALKLYEDEQQVDCPAVSYVKQLLHILGADDDEDGDSDNEDRVELEATALENPDEDDDDLPSSRRRRRLHLPPPALENLNHDMLFDHALFSHLAL